MACLTHYAMATLTIRSFNLPASLEVCIQVLGFLACFVSKACLTVRWILAIRQDDWDEFGRALLRRGLLPQAMIGPVLSVAERRWRRRFSSGHCFCIGVFGALVGIVRGLPYDYISLIT